MKTLFANGDVVNVFTCEIEHTNVLVEDGRIIGVGDYTPDEADIVVDATGKTICPGFIDGHIHIESTMLRPAELAKVCIPCGTTAIVADPHEITNVAGTDGIEYMLQASEGLPMQVYIMLPSCVPATGFDESGAVLGASDLHRFYDNPRVLGLAEMMNFPGVLAEDPAVLEKLADARASGKVINGHAPMLSGKALNKYIAEGIQDDHECTSYEEARERIARGQWVMIRQGTAARNLEALLPLFDEQSAYRCLLVTDDRHPADLISEGHIDNIIRLAGKLGKSVITGIRMATLQAAQCFGLRNVGAIAPGYRADLLLLDDLQSVRVGDVYVAGKKVCENRMVLPFIEPVVSGELEKKILASFHFEKLTAQSFNIAPKGSRCRVIKLIPGQLLTEEWNAEINWNSRNGIDFERDIIKLAVIERHHNTGHIGLGFISGLHFVRGAIASSVSHDSHNLIVAGADESDMAFAANRVKEIGGGCVVVEGGQVLAELPLPIGGLMGNGNAAEIAALNEALRKSVSMLGSSENAAQGTEAFMTTAFVSLTVIPSLKMTTLGLVDVDAFKRVSLYVD